MITKKFFNARKWHIWISVIFTLPLFVVGMTTFFIAHEKSLGMKDISLGTKIQEIEDFIMLPDSTNLIATKGGVFWMRPEGPKSIVELEHNEYRHLTPLIGGKILASGKQGLWLGTIGGKWTQLSDADIHEIHVNDTRWTLITKEQGVQVSSDNGLTWNRDASIDAMITLLPEQPMSLNKWVMDLHTGKAIFGKQLEWIWIDFLGFVLILVSLTGIYMWWKSKRRKYSK